jgi:hypothetical protein
VGLGQVKPAGPGLAVADLGQGERPQLLAEAGPGRAGDCGGGRHALRVRGPAGLVSAAAGMHHLHDTQESHRLLPPVLRDSCQALLGQAQEPVRSRQGALRHLAGRRDCR